MNSVVLDASALLALLFDEPGADRVARHIHEARISAVNLSEVIAKALERHMTPAEINAGLPLLPLDVIPFDTDSATLTAILRAQTRSLGLSLGDRACLALGMKLGTPVLTADRLWIEAGLDVEVITIR